MSNDEATQAEPKEPPSHEWLEQESIRKDWKPDVQTRSESDEQGD